MTPEPDRLLKDRDVAERYSISRRSVVRWVREGKIPCPVIGPGGQWRWRQSEIAQHIAGLAKAELAEAAR